MKAFNLAMTHLGFFFLGAATAISWSWPQRSFPKSSRQIPSRPFQKRWEPRT